MHRPGHRVLRIASALGVACALVAGAPAAPAQAVAPTITSFNPASGPVGTVVTINGTGFTGLVAVHFNAISAGFIFFSDTTLAATVPAGATTGPIVVTTPGGSGNSVTNFTVTPAGPGVVDCVANPSALQPAIDAARPGATLNISGTCVGTFEVSRTLTLVGMPGTLDAQGAGTALTVSSGKVKVIDLTITGGTGTDMCAPQGCFGGGGIINGSGATLRLRHSTVLGNVVPAPGTQSRAGGVLNLGALTSVESAVTGNSAANAGGISNAAVGASLTLKRSTVSENAATGGQGGGIANFNGASVNLAGSTVNGNSASFLGGGVYNAGALAVDGSSIDNNTASTGGGIFTSGVFDAMRSSVTDNSANSGGGVYTSGTATVAESTVSGNTAVFGGGGLLNEDGTLDITRSTVSDNSAFDPNGGGGGIFNSVFEGSSTVTIARSTVSGNSAPGFGGGIINVGAVTISNTTVSANTSSSGGGIYNGNSGPITGTSTLVASINAGNTNGDCSGTGTAVSNGYNLVGADCAFSAIGDQVVADTPTAIGIEPLGHFGGDTETMRLLPGSPALDAIPVGAVSADGATPLCPASGTTDQRGGPRPMGAGCDVGAYELRVKLAASGLTCPFSSFGGGDLISRGFYLSNYPSTRLDTVTLRYETFSTGTYTITLSARMGTYDGQLIGTSAVVVNLTAFVFQAVTFHFGSASVPQGGTITFTQSADGPGGLFFDVGEGGLGDPSFAGCPGVTETDDSIPPLDTFRRASVGVIVT